MTSPSPARCSVTYQRADALYAAEHDAIPWTYNKILIVEAALWSAEDLLRDLQQFTAVQERKRRNGAMYASYISRECTKNRERRTAARINRLIDVIDWVSPEEEEEDEEEEPNDDWLTFRNHETFIRRERNVGIPPQGSSAA
jgi:hypothetical protein